MSKSGENCDDIGFLSQWKTNDKDWMKVRKAAWKDVKPKIDKLIFLDREEKRALKDYFLTGNEGELIRLSREEERVLKEYFQIDDAALPEVPQPPSVLQKMEAAPLLEMWLNPDRSDAAWAAIKDKYANVPWATSPWDHARFRFEEINSSLDSYADGGSFFDGMEERMCRWFKLDTLKREDWPEWTDRAYTSATKRALSWARSFDNYLRDTNPNPYSIKRFQVRYWRDAMVVAYEGDFLGLEWMIRSLADVLRHPDKHHPLSVEMAKELQVVLKDPALPEAAQARIAELKAQYGCPD